VKEESPRTHTHTVKTLECGSSAASAVACAERLLNSYTGAGYGAEPKGRPWLTRYEVERIIWLVEEKGCDRYAVARALRRDRRSVQHVLHRKHELSRNIPKKGAGK
jgi:hypothetical protein